MVCPPVREVIAISNLGIVACTDEQTILSPLKQAHTYVSPAADSQEGQFSVCVNRLGGLSLPRKRVVRLNDRSKMTLAVYHGCNLTTILQGIWAQIQSSLVISKPKGPAETLRDIRTLTSQFCRTEENTNRTNKFLKRTCNLIPLVRNLC